MRFEAVKRVREEKGLTQGEVAQAVGKSLNWVYRVERRLTRPSREDAEVLSELLGVPVEELFTEVRDEAAA